MNKYTRQENRLKMQLQCPMPKLDFDVITLGHGSGGLLTSQLLDSGVFNILKNDILDKRHDGAILQLSGNCAFAADSFVISPIFFPGGNIGELAINGTVNDLAMCGAIPKYLSLSFIIEEGLTMEEFWRILVAIKFSCEESAVQVVTGDTKVVERGSGDKIFINTSGIGEVHPKADIDILNVKIGDKIIVSDKLAAHGIAIMSAREGLEFESNIESDTRNVNHIVANLLEDFGSNIHLLRDPTRGGVANVLTEIARDSNYGIDIYKKSIPIDEQVKVACDILGLDPIYVANEGVFISIVDYRVADNFLENLKNMNHCPHAAILGEVVASHPQQVILINEIGGRRVVNTMIGEQLPRIC